MTANNAAFLTESITGIEPSRQTRWSVVLRKLARLSLQTQLKAGFGKRGHRYAGSTRYWSNPLTSALTLCE
ncbi:hypothetical protein OH492_20530 [Vibrio chagasii]|nr:hypothetical protein [Vibrio chagasii]